MAAAYAARTQRLRDAVGAGIQLGISERRTAVRECNSLRPALYLRFKLPLQKHAGRKVDRGVVPLLTDLLSLRRRHHRNLRYPLPMIVDDSAQQQLEIGRSSLHRTGAEQVRAILESPR